MKYESYDTVVVGSGAAGYAAACRIAANGGNVAIVTEGRLCGTSRNTGSDKQTYYKLSLGGDTPDSVRRMASDLFSCGAVDGDVALCEAALSARAFMNLCELGVPFPRNSYGEFVGYRTDHDSTCRATSAGPLTSKFMTEALEAQAISLRIPILDGLSAVEILRDGDGVHGLFCLDGTNGGTVAIEAPHIVLATGGPAGIYADSVYPESQTGATGLGLLAGAAVQNMTEWQYGLASVAPRWNVSGTYMQVLPCFLSIGKDGDEHEFLLDSGVFRTPYEALSAVFLKGYQWPFDSAKVLSGSSVIDLLVYRETVLRGRRVFLDYRKNPFGLDTVDFSRLSFEANDYLSRAGAAFGTPIARLEKMNLPAVELYRSKGVDLAEQPLEIALCAQHCNGGFSVDENWQTTVPGLYATGECAGTHGITRPGGSALNAGQVGAIRAAEAIAHDGRTHNPAVFEALADKASENHRSFEAALLRPDGAEDICAALPRMQALMSACGAAVRDGDGLRALLDEVNASLADFSERFTARDARGMALAYKLRDILTAQSCVISALLNYTETVKKSRGSALCYDPNGELRQGLPEFCRLSLGADDFRGKIQQMTKSPEGFSIVWRPVRPLPPGNDVFEVVWNAFRRSAEKDCTSGG